MRCPSDEESDIPTYRKHDLNEKYATKHAAFVPRYLRLKEAVTIARTGTRSGLSDLLWHHPGALKRLRLTAIVVITLLALASVSVKLPRNLEVSDPSGTPAHPVYVAYSYFGSRLNPVDSVTYRAGRLTLARSDQPGRVVIPSALHVHKPFPLETHPRLHVEFVYVPRLHNATARMNDDRAVVADLTGQPDLWHGTLTSIVSMISRFTARTDGEPSLRDAEPAEAALVTELITHFRREYEVFLERYRDTPRPRAQMPEHIKALSEEEQRRWREFTDASLAREPLWGMLVTRLFEEEVKRLTQLDLELR